MMFNFGFIAKHKISYTPKTVTAYGNAQISTAQSKFGGASGLFDGTGDYLTFPYSSDFAVGASNATIDFWIRPAATINTRTFLFTIAGLTMEVYSSTEVDFYDLDASTSYYFTQSFLADTWYHIAIVKNGTTTTIYINGTYKSADIGGTPTGTWAQNTGGGVIAGTGSAYFYNGYIEEFRFSNGIARWTTNFTPPTSAYTVDAYTKLLLHMDGTNGSTTFTDGN